MAAIIVAICALIALALFDLLALRYGVDIQGPLAPRGAVIESGGRTAPWPADPPRRARSTSSSSPRRP